METFEKLEVWRRSKDLAVRICRAMRESRDFGFRDQITRAAVSVPSNIAEVVERISQAEFNHLHGSYKR